MALDRPARTDSSRLQTASWGPGDGLRGANYPGLTSLTGGNFFLHSMDRERRSVCMFSSSFFTASGLLVDIFDGDRRKKKPPREISQKGEEEKSPLVA